MLRLFFSRNRVFTKLDHQISRPASTQNLNRIFQTHPVMCDDDQLKEYLYEKQQAHLKNLTLCKNLKNWYFDQVVDQFGSDAGEKFKENCIIAPFGSSVTYLSTKDSDLDIGVFYQNYTDEMSLTDLVKFTDSTYIKNTKNPYPIDFYKMARKRRKNNVENSRFHLVSVSAKKNKNYDIVFSTSSHNFHNSKYINRICSIDRNVFRYVALVRYCLKEGRLNFSDRNRGNFMFTSYCITTLAIVYLQIEGYIPRLNHLQRGNNNERKYKNPELLIDLKDSKTAEKFARYVKLDNDCQLSVLNLNEVSENIVYDMNYTTSRMILKKEIEDLPQLTIDFWKWLMELIDSDQEHSIVIDSRRAKIFSSKTLSQYYHSMYRMIPCDLSNGTDVDFLKKSQLTVFDPLEVMHNTCRKYMSTKTGGANRKNNCRKQMDFIVRSLIKSKVYEEDDSL